jgi:hypothetical protein
VDVAAIAKLTDEQLARVGEFLGVLRAKGVTRWGDVELAPVAPASDTAAPPREPEEIPGALDLVMTARGLREVG